MTPAQTAAIEKLNATLPTADRKALVALWTELLDAFDGTPSREAAYTVEHLALVEMTDRFVMMRRAWHRERGRRVPAYPPSENNV